jgi:16S rRNA (guanine527-N7)-methyltransferase
MPPKADPQLHSSLAGVPRETLDRLRQYQALLEKWQRAINLVGPATIPDAWNRHFIDSTQLLSLLPHSPATLYDLGCGAGFPGLVLAMMCPDLSVTLIESDQKKCAFLATVSHETKTEVKILTTRIEAAAETLPPPDIITARALAALPLLLTYIKPWAEANPNLICIFPKGAQAAAEIEAAQEIAGFDVKQQPSQTDSVAQILVLSNILYK